jgi:hypothetical protein
MKVPTTPTMTVDQVAELYAISRASAYKAVNEFLATGGASGIPALRVGRRIIAPTAAVLRQLGLDPEAAA